jgi:hypothetical protein
MTATPPPLEPGRLPGTGDAPVPADVRAPGGAWALAWVAAGCGVLTLLCTGGAAALVAAGIEQAGDELSAKGGRIRAEQAASSDAEVVLDALADAVLRDATNELPEALPEAPPPDSWGTPVRYRRLTPLRAALTSAGPDCDFGTGDDVERLVELR